MVQAGPKSSDECPREKQREMWGARGEGYAMTGVETGVTHPQAKDHEQPPEARPEAWDSLPPGLRKGPALPIP